jgi:gamma-glutamylcyclotransferase (GGCT)/AIG2-like uncharacterized protein YtfP
VSELLYFAYGSNLFSERMRQRVPSSRVLTTGWLSGYQLYFHKRGGDGSGKCNLLQTGDDAHTVHGAVYAMAATEKPLLDRFEGSEYLSRDVQIAPHAGGEAITAYAYIARQRSIDDSLLPFDWYRALVLAGAAEHSLPADYCGVLAQIGSVPDPDDERDRINRYGVL